MAIEYTAKELLEQAKQGNIPSVETVASLFNNKKRPSESAYELLYYLVKKGKQGPQGDQGHRGDKGPVGDNGPKGDTGEQGDPSPELETVSVGLQNLFTGNSALPILNSYGSSTVTSKVTTFPNSDKSAVHYTVVGGTSAIKLFRFTTAIQGVYTSYGLVLNNGDKPIAFHDNHNTQVIEPGKLTKISVTSTKRDSAGLHYRFQTMSVGDNMDIYIAEASVTQSTLPIGWVPNESEIRDRLLDKTEGTNLITSEVKNQVSKVQISTENLVYDGNKPNNGNPLVGIHAYPVVPSVHKAKKGDKYQVSFYGKDTTADGGSGWVDIYLKADNLGSTQLVTEPFDLVEIGRDRQLYTGTITITQDLEGLNTEGLRLSLRHQQWTGDIGNSQNKGDRIMDIQDVCLVKSDVPAEFNHSVAWLLDSLDKMEARLDALEKGGQA